MGPLARAEVGVADLQEEEGGEGEVEWGGGLTTPLLWLGELRGYALVWRKKFGGRAAGTENKVWGMHSPLSLRILSERGVGLGRRDRGGLRACARSSLQALSRRPGVCESLVGLSLPFHGLPAGRVPALFLVPGCSANRFRPVGFPAPHSVSNLLPGIIRGSLGTEAACAHRMVAEDRDYICSLGRKARSAVGRFHTK